MTQRIMIVGAYGKMGTVATATLRKSNNFEIIPVGRQDDLSSQLKTHKPSAVLELTDKSSVYENCQKILSAACPLVIGASGLRDPERKHLDEIAIEHETPCLLVPNFPRIRRLQICSQLSSRTWYPFCNRNQARSKAYSLKYLIPKKNFITNHYYEYSMSYINIAF